MSSYEYKVVPAPAKGKKGRGLRGPEERFAFSLEHLMNEMAADGWEYQRAETLPSEEKTSLVGAAQTVYRNVLVFRRQRSADLTAFDPRVIGEGRTRPLLLAPVDETAQDSDDGSGGLSSLLRRRAASVKTDEDEGLPPDPEVLDDLASRFAAEADEGAESEVSDATPSALPDDSATPSATDETPAAKAG